MLTELIKKNFLEIVTVRKYEAMATTTSSWVLRNEGNEREAVLEQNAAFAVNIVKEALGETVELNQSSVAYRTLSNCVSQVLANCESQIRALVNQLDLSRGSLFPDKFASMADELFEAERGYDIRWERIVTLFAFAWVLSQRLQQGQLTGSSTPSSTASVSKILTGYLNDKIALWIQQRGGWVKLCDEFGEEDSSTASNKWKYFFLTGLGIGLVATYKLTH